MNPGPFRSAVLAASAAIACPSLAFGQQTKPVLKPLPADMDCERVTGEKVEVPSGSDTLIKRGGDYYLCRPKSEGILSQARTASFTVRSTQTISCGDGSPGDCLRQDTATEKTIEGLVDNTDLWRYFKQAPSTKADLILKIVANDRANSTSPISLFVQDSDTGSALFYESRQVTDLENDVNRLVEHFLRKTNRSPLYSKAEMDTARQCARVADELRSAQIEYDAKLADYTFKNTHPSDAQADECNLHWKDYVCLAKGSGIYGEAWSESGVEMRRKLQLEFEELHAMEQQLAILRQHLCN